MEKKQTAVEWLEQAYWDNKGTLSQKHFEQAKQMEKEQIMDAFVIRPYTNFEKYYNETYGETKN
jgi:alkylhydroperoxidase family enzyme